MRIDTFFDLFSAWRALTILGRIFYSWVLILGWIILLATSIYLNCAINFGQWSGFLRFNEPEEN
jgi:hypothetical protein